MKQLTPLIAAAAVMLAGAALAAPVNVRTEGTKAQTVIMCPDCRSKIACAGVGDYVIGLSVDLENAKLGSGTLTAHVQDKSKHPVTDAKVSVALSMPDHKHGGKPIAMKHAGHGKYSAAAQHLGMTGRYRAEVSVKTAGDDTVKQVFSFSR